MEALGPAYGQPFRERGSVSSVDGGRLFGEVLDEGIGALENLRAGLALDDHLHALQELSRGKTTTDPERHTGEGLFFSSKMVDRSPIPTSTSTR